MYKQKVPSTRGILIATGPRPERKLLLLSAIAEFQMNRSCPASSTSHSTGLSRLSGLQNSQHGPSVCVVKWNLRGHKMSDWRPQARDCKATTKTLQYANSVMDCAYDCIDAMPHACAERIPASWTLVVCVFQGRAGFFANGPVEFGGEQIVGTYTVISTKGL